MTVWMDVSEMLLFTPSCCLILNTKAPIYSSSILGAR